MLEEDIDISQIAELCKIRLKDENKIRKNLVKILQYAELLNEVDTQDVLPCTHVLETIINVFREDETGPSLSRTDFLANAPDHVGGMIKIPPVIQFEDS